MIALQRQVVLVIISTEELSLKSPQLNFSFSPSPSEAASKFDWFISVTLLDVVQCPLLLMLK